MDQHALAVDRGDFQTANLADAEPGRVGYLRYVLDLWAHRWRRREATWSAFLVDGREAPDYRGDSGARHLCCEDDSPSWRQRESAVYVATAARGGQFAATHRPVELVPVTIAKQPAPSLAIGVSEPIGRMEIVLSAGERITVAQTRCSSSGWSARTTKIFKREGGHRFGESLSESYGQHHDNIEPKKHQ
jgi:hypothetical protein